MMRGMDDARREPAAPTGGPALAPGRGPEQTRARHVARTLAVLALVAVSIPVLARLTGIEAGPLAILVALMPWVTLACLIPLALALAARAWAVAGIAAGVLALCVAWQAPLFSAGAGATAEDAALTVASVSATFGRVDADAVVALVREGEVDVLAVQELTPDAADALVAARLEDTLPYAVLLPEKGFTGTGLWSALPLGDSGEVEGMTSRAPWAVAEVDGRAVTVFAPHPAAPGPTDHARWAADLDVLRDAVAEIDGAVLVVGDLNATRDHRAFRAIEALGCVDAADDAGAGFLPTFPEGRGLFPVAAIDHVLECGTGLGAVAVETTSIEGADHRALVVRYGAPADA